MFDYKLNGLIYNPIVSEMGTFLITIFEDIEIVLFKDVNISILPGYFALKSKHNLFGKPRKQHYPDSKESTDCRDEINTITQITSGIQTVRNLRIAETK